MQKEVHKVEKTKKYSELFIETCTTVGSTNKNKDACLGGELLPPAGPTLFPSHQKITSIMLFDQSSSVITQPKACYLELFLWMKNIQRAKAPDIYGTNTEQCSKHAVASHLRIEVVALLQSLLDPIFSYLRMEERLSVHAITFNIMHIYTHTHILPNRHF